MNGLGSVDRTRRHICSLNVDQLRKPNPNAHKMNMMSINGLAPLNGAIDVCETILSTKSAKNSKRTRAAITMPAMHNALGIRGFPLERVSHLRSVNCQEPLYEESHDDQMSVRLAPGFG